MGLESDILSDFRQLLTEHGVSARWQGIDLLVLVSRVKREQQMAELSVRPQNRHAVEQVGFPLEAWRDKNVHLLRDSGKNPDLLRGVYGETA